MDAFFYNSYNKIYNHFLYKCFKTIVTQHFNEIEIIENAWNNKHDNINCLWNKTN